MKLSGFKNDTYVFTGKLSDINRQIAFAGIALIWVFRVTTDGGTSLSSDLIFPAILFAIALGLDMLQYIWQSIAWSVFHWHEEKRKIKDDPELLAPYWMNYPSWILFTLKVSVVIIGYIYVIIFLIGELLILDKG